MKIPKILLCALLVGVLASCKKKDDCDASGSNTAVAHDTVATTDTTAVGTTSGNNKIHKAARRRELTSAEIDSIKAERDKLVTPPSNSGASLTPGSGRAVPGNNKSGPGTPANMGSSTGTDNN